MNQAAATLEQHAATAAHPQRGTLRRILELALPATLTIILSSSSLLVDTYFVTKLGSDALAGVSLVFPLYLVVVMAFGGGIGVGLSVVISVELGRGDISAAQRAVGAAFALALGLSLLVALSFVGGGHALFSSIASSPAALDAAMRFAAPLAFGSPVIALALTITNLLRSEGKVKQAATALLLGAAVNALLNPLLIDGRLGLPRLGVAGAALATLLGFVASACVGALCFGKSSRLSLAPARLSFRRKDVSAILAIALPTLATYVTTNVVFLVLTSVCARFGTEAVASYGLAMRLEYLIVLAVYGFGGAIMTLGGEAWGAGQRSEFLRICRICAGCVFGATCVLSALLVAYPRAWFELFHADPEAVALGARYLQVAALGYPFYALALCLNYAYQTLGFAALPLVFTLGRGFLVAVPGALLAAAAGGAEHGLAWAVATSLVLQGAATLACLRRALDRKAQAQRGRTAQREGALPRLEIVRIPAVRLSPYPWHYSLRWPWYFRRPSTRNRTGMRTLPLRFERPTLSAEPTLKLCAIGDIMVMQGDRVPVLHREVVSAFADADLVLGCCEAPLARPHCDPAAVHHFAFNMPADYLRGVIDQSRVPPQRWCLSVANNHAGDVGPNGLDATLEYMHRQGVQAIGARRHGDTPLTVIEHEGMRVGFAAWTHWLNVPGVPVWRTQHIEALDFRELRDRHALDCLVGSAHWEYEWQHFPCAETRQRAQRLARGGFDLIVGSHPHVVQPFEWIDDTLCAYSLGNFCSGLGPSFAARVCSVLQVEIARSGPQRGRVVRYTLRLFAQVDDGERVTLLPLSAAPQRLRDRIQRRVSRVFDGTTSLSTAG